MLLVIAVVYLFLQNMRATLIPILAVPVSIIGAFAGMYLLGFSINLLTLFGLEHGTKMYFEASLLFAMVGFISTVAYAKFVLRGDIIE